MNTLGVNSITLTSYNFSEFTALNYERVGAWQDEGNNQEEIETFVIEQKCKSTIKKAVGDMKIDDVFRQLKTIMPELQTIYIQSNNARCYYCTQTLITAP